MNWINNFLEEWLDSIVHTIIYGVLPVAVLFWVLDIGPNKNTVIEVFEIFPMGSVGTIEIDDNNVRLLKLNETEVVGCELTIESINFEDLTMSETNIDKYGRVKINFNEIVCENGTKKINGFAVDTAGKVGISIKNPSPEKTLLSQVSEIGSVQNIIFKN